jgi:hypothetical protein
MAYGQTQSSEYVTGEKAPFSGRYGYVRHTQPGVYCQPTLDEMEIRLTLGERFPPHRSCNQGVVWRYLGP